MSNQRATVSDAFVMPWERSAPEGGDSAPTPVDRLFGMLDSPEELTDGSDESVAAGAAETESEAEADTDSDEDSREGTPESTTPEDADAEDTAEDAAEGAAEGAEGEDTGDDSEASEPETFTISVDGEEITVARDELVRGYSRQATFTKKMQQLAEQRQAADTERTQTQQLRDQYVERIALFEQAIEASRPAEPDWDTLRREDPAEFAAQLAERDQRERQIAVARAERGRLQQETEDGRAQIMHRLLEEERQKLEVAIPEFGDPAKATAEKTRMAAYARDTYGFSDEDLSRVYDHRVMLLLRKAMQWDDLQTNTKPEALKKAKAKAKPPVVMKPGSPKPAAPANAKELARRREQLTRTGRVDDAAAAIFAMLPD